LEFQAKMWRNVDEGGAEGDNVELKMLDVLCVVARFLLYE
jgi:hypothetical protein